MTVSIKSSIAFVLILLMSLGLTGCNGKNMREPTDPVESLVELETPSVELKDEPIEAPTANVPQETIEDPNLGKEISDGSEDTTEPADHPELTRPTDPVETNPTKPTPTNPTPSDPKPTDPTPTEPTPTQPPHTHSYTATVVAPTCTEKGIHTS